METSFFIPILSEITFEKEQVGYNINQSEVSLNTDIIVLSVAKKEVSPSSYLNIRETFFQLYKGNWNLNITDLGHLVASEDLEQNQVVFNEVFELSKQYNARVLILSEDATPVYQSYRSLSQKEDSLNVSLLQPKIPLVLGEDIENLNNQNILNHLMVQKPRKLNNYFHLGYQTYYHKMEILDLVEDLNFFSKRLGYLSQNLIEAEPDLRESHIIGFSVESIKYSDAPRPNKIQVNGFSALESSTISRYIGMSSNNNVFVLYDYEKSVNSLVEQSLSQFLWYYLEGCSLKKIEKPAFKNNNYITYFVPIENKRELIFFKSKITSKWWIAFEINEKEMVVKSCSYKDYKDATKSNIPECYWKYFKRYY